LRSIDGTVTGQAAVLSFDHAFQVIALFFLGALLAVPFLPRKTRPAPGMPAPVDH
jgi:hypothetical protein